MSRRRVRRRAGTGGQEQDLVVALARLEAVFGPVEVLEVRPHPRLGSRPRPAADRACPAAQGVLGLDRQGRQEGGAAVA